LLCDGSAVSRSTYATLFGVIGTTFGAGDGSSTFNVNVPDLRGRAPIGEGTASGGGSSNRTLGTKGGAEEVSLTSSTQLPSHNHTLNDPGHIHGVPISNSGSFGTGGQPPSTSASGDVDSNTPRYR
jgi:microcystin-dependent protein